MANVKSGYAKLGGSTQAFVIPAKAGIQAFGRTNPDGRLREHDGWRKMCSRVGKQCARETIMAPRRQIHGTKKPPEISQQSWVDKRSVIQHKPEIF
jgi:hypothetical protein